MGFLLGAYGKLAAGSRYRSLQARMMRIQSKLRRATRDVANMEKFIDRRQKSMEQQVTQQNAVAKNMYQGQMYQAMNNTAIDVDGYKTIGELSNAINQGKITDANKLSSYSSIISKTNAEFSSKISSMTGFADMQASMTKEQIANEIEYMRDMLLEPLKDEEDSLQLEKDTLESQIQVAKADYEACQKMEQADVKMLTPNYTGGQG
ncbi:hypothetical protein J6O86_08730 [bacterium]|nr:hypothetical protein [bacterium]